MLTLTAKRPLCLTEQTFAGGIRFQRRGGHGASPLVRKARTHQSGFYQSNGCDAILHLDIQEMSR